MISSEVYERGLSKNVTMTRSMSASAASVTLQLLHSWGCAKLRMRSAIARDRVPDKRTTPMPPRPEGVEMATIVSSVFIGADLGPEASRNGRNVRRGPCRRPDRGAGAEGAAGEARWAFPPDRQS